MKSKNESCSAQQTIAACNSNTMVQNDCPSKDAEDVFKNIDEEASKNDGGNPSKNIDEDQVQNDTTPAPQSLVLKDITIKVDTTQSITLEITGATEEYVIKTISLKNKNNYHTTKLGLNRLKGEAIGSSGITFPLPEQFSLKPGAYILRITVAKNEKNSKKQAVQCTVTIS